MKLSRCDTALLVLIGLWIAIGVPGNYVRVHGNGLFPVLLLVTNILVLVLWAAMASLIAYSAVRGQRRFAAYGFSFRTGGLLSLAVAAAIHVYLVVSGKLGLSVPANLGWIALGALMEELAFRAILIDEFLLLLDGVQSRAFWAILASSVLFTVAHIASKSAAMIPGIFISALIMGYVYYKTRSIALPAWYHGLSNAGNAGGMLVVAVYCAIAAADVILGLRRNQVSRAAVAR